MSSIPIHSRPLPGGRDARRGQGNDEGEGITAGACDSASVGAPTHAEGSQHIVGRDGSADPTPAATGRAGRRSGAGPSGTGPPLEPADPRGPSNPAGTAVSRSTTRRCSGPPATSYNFV